MATNTPDNIVYLVNVFHGNKLERSGVFSCLGTATFWISSLPKDRSYLGFPMKIDEPDFKLVEEVPCVSPSLLEEVREEML